MTAYRVDKSSLDSIFHECRQCGACCKKYRRILLQPDEVEFIKKMGGHVGVDLHL
ncbi:MAG: YkgJ family cysteine cluster protein, partial [Deltaproteobacteria bacterium]